VSSPYREAPLLLPCPRCSEMLDRAFEGVAVCPRCQGAWIGQATLDTAFGNPRWPPGQEMWWQDPLACPECAAQLSPRNSNGVMVDTCVSHGVWLDRGELGRLMSLATGADELLALRKKIAAVADPEGLRQRRQAWRAEIEAQRSGAFRAQGRPKRRDDDVE